MYHQRWTVLRQPLRKPPGSERDYTKEAEGTYYAIALIEGNIIGLVRLRFVKERVRSIAQILSCTS